MVARYPSAVRLPTFAYRAIGRFSVTRFDQLLHPFLYRLTGGGSLFGRSLGNLTLLLTTIGRRSGESRTVALWCFPVGPAVGSPAGSLAVVGTRGGSRKIPAWYHNLVATPTAMVQVGRRRFAARPRELTGDAYESVFEQAAASYPGYRLYRAEATQHVPIVVLEPVAA
jgi:deazaflavin-dependent oxidoreductase (nitroreductase family)